MLVPSLAAAATPETRAFAAWLAADETLIRITGCMLLFGGGLVVLCHRHWSNAPAVLINVFAWVVTIRGAMLIALPHLMLRDEAGVLIPFPVLRLGFGALFLMGVWLTFVGWSVEPATPDAPLSRDPSARRQVGGRLASRRRTLREIAHSASAAHPIRANGTAIGQADAPSIWPTIAPIAAALVCCTKPISDEAAPARSGNGVSAPAMACGMASPMPNR